MKQKYLIILLIFIGCKLNAQPSEYLLKAAFLEKFARFTEWPEETKIQDIKIPFIIGVIGDSPFNGALEFMYAEQKIKNKKVQVKYLTSITDISMCNLLFICESEKKNLSKILDFTRSKPILTISETEGFAKKGVHVNFYITDDETIHFEINENAVKSAGLRMNLMLLDIAKLVN